MNKLFILLIVLLPSFNCAGQVVKKFTEIKTTAVDPVNIDASFPYGDDSLRRFLSGNINTYLSVEKGAPAGTYKVTAEFYISTEGYVSEIKMLTKAGYGMEDELKRVLLSCPRWIPAKEKGKAVKAWRSQSVFFTVDP